MAPTRLLTGLSIGKRRWLHGLKSLLGQWLTVYIYIYMYIHIMIRARNVRGAVQCSHAGRCGQLKMPSRLSVTENQMEKTMDNEMEAGIA